MKFFFVGAAVSLIAASAVSQPDFKNYEQAITGTSIKFQLVAVPGGKFKIGSAPSEKNRDTDEGPQKEIEISSFWMGAKEVTFAEWDLYFKDASLPQSKNIDGVTRATPQYIDLTWSMGRDRNHPANSMSQMAAIMYCKWLYSKTGIFYRLPTEAEWEYACKAGALDPKAVQDFGYFTENSGGKFHHVGEKRPNAIGLFDMLGNLSEWTLDQYDPIAYAKMPSKDPVITPVSKYPRVVRGGSYLDDAASLRCANRLSSDAKWNQRDPQIPKSKWWLTDGMFVGFRIARPMKQPLKEDIEKFFADYLK